MIKHKLVITAIVALAIAFIGIAGGFTKTEYGSWVDELEKCSIPVPFTPQDRLEQLRQANTNPFMPQDWLKKEKQECEAVGGVWEKGEKYFREVNKTRPNTPYRTRFDPKSTALFVIAGAIIALVGLGMRKKKEGN